MRRFALPFLVLAFLASAPPAWSDALSPDRTVSAIPVPCELDGADASLMLIDWRARRGGVQLACSQGCLRRCAAVYRRCQAQSRDWRQCSAVRRNCIRSCGC